jgi:hypothetical protein
MGYKIYPDPAKNGWLEDIEIKCILIILSSRLNSYGFYIPQRCSNSDTRFITKIAYIDIYLYKYIYLKI